MCVYVYIYTYKHIVGGVTESRWLYPPSPPSSASPPPCAASTSSQQRRWGVSG